MGIFIGNAGDTWWTDQLVVNAINRKRSRELTKMLRISTYLFVLTFCRKQKINFVYVKLIFDMLIKL